MPIHDAAPNAAARAIIAAQITASLKLADEAGLLTVAIYLNTALIALGVNGVPPAALGRVDV